MNDIKQQAINGVFWTFSQQFSVQIINFGVQIILARLLMPEDFGLIAMLTVFIAVGQMLMDGGMTSSLIRTKNPDQLDYSTVFISNILVSLFIYLILFWGSPFIGAFFEQPLLADIIKLYAMTFVIRSFVAVHVAKLTKEMDFKTQMKLQIPSTIFGAIVGVTLALLGYGVWSLVWLNLTQTLVFTIQNWIFIKWRPSFVFDKARFKHHFNFGYKMTLSGLLDTVYRNIYTLIIGKFFSVATVGFYNQAESMRLFPVNQIGTVMGKVTFPLFSNLENDKQLKNAYKTTMKLVLFAVIPVMLFLIVIAEDFFFFLFGEKWLPAVPYFQILALASIVRPISSYNLNILKVKGRSDLFLKVEVYKKILGVISIAIALPFGIMPLVISLAVVSYFFTGINMWQAGKLIAYRTVEQLGDVYKLFIFGGIAVLATYFFRLFLLDYIDPKIIIMLTTGSFFAFIYLVEIFVLEKDMINTLKKLKKRQYV